MIADQATALRGLMLAQDVDAPVSAAPARRTERHARTIAVTSGKGGVGKTSIAVNLAVHFAKLGRRTIVLDADLGTANVDVLCNLMPSATLAHVVAGRRAIEDTLIDAPGGFRLVPGASGLAQVANLSEFERGRLLNDLHRLESRADVMIIDTGAGVGANVLSFCVAADEVLVVTTPEPTAITDGYAVIKSIVRQKPEAEIRVLVNQVRDEREARAVFERISAVCRKFLSVAPRYAGHVVSDERVRLGVHRRRPFALEAPTTPASNCICHLAHRMDRYASPSVNGGLFSRVASWWSR